MLCGIGEVDVAVCRRRSRQACDGVFGLQVPPPLLVNGGSCRDRTCDTLIKSQVLYELHILFGFQTGIPIY